MQAKHSLPFERKLLITTSNAIHLRSQTGGRIVFECESAEGIMNACATTDNSSLLAVADSQLVLLHDTAQTRVKKHKLRYKDAGSIDPHRTEAHSYQA